jgi:RHS repeat-associated protein
MSTRGTDSYDLAYDALGRCVKRVVNGVIKYYIYDGERPILEYRATGGVPAKNLYGKGIDEILMRYDPTISPSPSPSPAPNPRTFYYQQDHEGSVRYLTDAGGNRIEEYRYDVFGTPTIYDMANPHHVRSASIVSNRFMFTGREYAAAFKFYEYRARAYNPELGRFMSEDPKLFDAGDYNLFRYCHNDPIDLTDPMGLDTDWAQVSFETGMTFLGAGIGAFIGGTGGGALGLAGGPAAPATVPAGAGIGGAQGATMGAALGYGVGHALAPILFNRSNNPYGSKGKPDHQEANARSHEEAKRDAQPGEKALREQKIQGLDSNRRPDVQIVGKDGVTRKVIENERNPSSARNLQREAEYNKLGIEHQTNPIKPPEQPPSFKAELIKPE